MHYTYAGFETKSKHNVVPWALLGRGLTVVLSSLAISGDSGGAGASAGTRVEAVVNPGGMASSGGSASRWPQGRHCCITSE